MAIWIPFAGFAFYIIAGVAVGICVCESRAWPASLEMKRMSYEPGQRCVALRCVYAAFAKHIIAAKIYVSPLNLCYKLRQLYVYYVQNNRLLLQPTTNCQQPTGKRNASMPPPLPGRLPQPGRIHSRDGDPARARPTRTWHHKRGIIFTHNCINNALFSVNFIQLNLYMYNIYIYLYFLWIHGESKPPYCVHY